MVMTAVRMLVAVTMTMMSMTEGRHPNEIDDQSEAANGKKLSNSLHFASFNETFYSFVDNLDTNEPC